MELLSTLRYPLLASAAAQAEKQEPAMFTVVLTGLLLVFFILVLLWAIVTLEGKIFQAIENKKAGKAKVPKAKPAEVPAQAADAPAQPAGPAIDSRVPPDVVAAITAAVAAASDGKYTLRGITTVQKGRGQWGLAGVIQNTEPF